jgi:dienelactone hydrolase
VLVVHEWWGHNEYARKRATMLAELGYVALAVDMYGDGKTAGHPDDAGKFAGEVMKNKAVGEARFNAALEFVKQQPSVDPSRIAAIGYCFGGGVVLHMARQGADLKGVASFHGSLATDAPAKAGAVKARVLVFTGDADKMIPPAQVAAFRDEMTKAGASFRIVGYPGVMHSFTNPDADKLGAQFKLPIAYDKKADLDSWAQTELFFNEIFAK